jgi:hypothetical protein
MCDAKQGFIEKETFKRNKLERGKGIKFKGAAPNDSNYQ